MKNIRETISTNSQKIRGYLETSEVRLYYERFGEGLPILLLHGNKQSHHIFHSYASRLKKSYQVILMDSRGHGHSELLHVPSQPDSCQNCSDSEASSKHTSNDQKLFTIGDMACDVASLLDYLKIPKAILFGFSDGANIALEFASRFPERTLAVISASGNALPHGLILPVRIGTLALGGVLSAAQKLFPEGKLHRQLNGQLQMNTLLTDSPNLPAERLQKIQAPVLLLAGTHDLIKTAHTQWMSRQIPNSQLCLLEGGTHNVLFSREQLCLGKILYFLQEHKLS